MTAKLYSLSVSHPARAAGLMLRHKGIDHTVVNLLPGSQRVALRALGFRAGTVPAMKIDGRRVQGSLRISRVLEDLQPEPPLYPADPRQRAAVEDAEVWGEADYQPVPRRLTRWGLSRDAGARRSFAELTDMRLPALSAHATQPLAAWFARAVGATDEQVRADFAALPSLLDRIDGLIGDGVLGGEQLNAADFQIGTTTKILLGFAQVREMLEGRPAAQHAMLVAPGFGGESPIRVPEAWLPD